MRTHGNLNAGAQSRAAGMTLAELILATGLAAIVMGALLQIVDSALNLWTKGEAVRQAREATSAVAAVMANDLRQLHGSPEGDVLVDYEVFDVDRDGQVERLWPRMRFIRDASAREAAWIGRRALAEAARMERERKRIEAGDEAEDEEELLTEEELLKAAGVTRKELALGEGMTPDTSATELLEILYAVVPEGDEGDARYTGMLVRGERIHRAGEPHVLMRDDVFDRRGVPDPVFSKEVARGVLWMRPLMATQTTHVLPPEKKEDRRAWTTGGGSIQDAATSWDAWRRGRPNVDASSWNKPAPGMPRAGLKPLLPRRIRLELELQRTSDRKRAPELVDAIGETASSFEVSNGKRAKALVGRHAMVGGEWMKITGVSGDRVTVQRATRLTLARAHPSGTKLMVGAPAVIDLPIVMYEDDWRLGASSVDSAAPGGGR